jgi:hypothetical protein
MSVKTKSLNAISFVAGFATCALVGAAVLAGPQWQGADQEAVTVQSVQVAKYQPGVGEVVVQERRARNDAMGQMVAPDEMMQACPRCR